MVSLVTTWETWRTPQRREDRGTYYSNIITGSHQSFISFPRSSRDSPPDGANRCFISPPEFHSLKSCRSGPWELRVCLQSWTDKSVSTPPELIQNPVDLAQRKKKKTRSISGVQRSLPRRPPPPPSPARPPTSRYGVSRPQSALCCSVLFTLFVVLNLIVINIFDLLCIWQAYLLRKKKKKKCFVWLVLHFEMYLLGSLYSEIFLPRSTTNSISNKAKVQFYCTGATTDFCVDNQWCFGLKSQTNKRYLRWRDLRCKEKYSLVNGERDTARLKTEQRVKSLLFDSFIRNQQE